MEHLWNLFQIGITLFGNYLIGAILFTMMDNKRRDMFFWWKNLSEKGYLSNWLAWFLIMFWFIGIPWMYIKLIKKG